MASTIMDFLNGVKNKLFGGGAKPAKQLKVGFIKGSTYPDGTMVATVAIRNEYGDPANNQDPRPFFRNAISEHEKEWSDTIARGFRAGLPLEQILEVVGAQIRGDVQESIATLMEPPIRKSTIAARRARGNASTKPLVDTKVMIGDVNYEVGEIESS